MGGSEEKGSRKSLRMTAGKSRFLFLKDKLCQHFLKDLQAFADFLLAVPVRFNCFSPVEVAQHMLG